MTSLLRKRSGLSKKAELKLQIAQESREPAYDLSDCQLTEVPKCVASQVKYFNKTVLILHSNLLHRLCCATELGKLSHLTHLDLHSNKFWLFPNEILSMPFLKVLDLSFNEIRVVPDRIDQLARIERLNFEKNRVQCIPPSVGNLRSLEELLFGGNPITHLPVTLGHLKQLKDISLPLNSIIFPPKDICEIGVPAILSFLCSAERLGAEESAFTEVDDKGEEMEDEMERFRDERKRERFELITTLHDKTKYVDDLICRLRQKQHFLRKEDQPQSPTKHLHKTISDPRKGMLGEDCLTRADGETDVESVLRCVLVSRQADKAQLVSQVAIEAGKQTKALECLQHQRDLRRQRIVDDIQLVEKELCRLTRMERERKASQSALVVAHFYERRRDLILLLSELQHQKERRDLELHEILKSSMADCVCASPSASRTSELVGNFEKCLFSNVSTPTAAGNPSLSSSLAPSAPSENEDRGESTVDNTDFSCTAPSAPPAIIARFENECCICQDAQCSIIFLPCGHVCCCKLCSVKVILCPLCRNTVEQHIQLS